MLGKVIEFKPLARQKESTSPARSSLADAILQQFLTEADAPARCTHAPAQILTFSQDGRGRGLRVTSQVQIHLTSPFTLAYWLNELSDPPTSRLNG